ncbi:MAG: tryptophan 7-halogenase [Alteromonadaceae bacterium]|nr:tryptophan 7-halogenase [Alteromonadaceae bacterium]
MHNAQPKKMVIVGGGTAGWMCAAYLAKHWQSQYRITLIESPQISTVGVGEGSTPFLKQFFADLGWQEKDWMPACDATYKTGITFSHWTSSKRFSEYFHPFFSALDLDTAEHFFSQCEHLRCTGQNAAVKPEDYFTAAEMVRQCVSPVSSSLPFDIDYAYHFDAGRLANCLREFAVGSGVEHLQGNVIEVHANSDKIEQLVTDCSANLSADLFIDCSGFNGLLAKQSLGQTMHSYGDSLLNDRAIAIPTTHTSHQPLAPHTRSEALSNGWMWNIPLTSRIGNGYVYSSQFCSADEAEIELRQRLGVSDDIPARHLNMTVGRLDEHWRGNCVAIGLSQGFIEPLEATALMLVQYALYQLSPQLETPMPTANVKQRYNREMNRMFDGIRDYIVAHYYLNTRQDSAYWRACRNDITVPDNLAVLLNAWDSGACFDTALESIDEQLVYLRPSWYSILAGMGRFHIKTQAHPAIPAPADIGKQLSSTVSHYFKHALYPAG